MTLKIVSSYNGVSDPDAAAYISAVEATDGELLEFAVGKAINDFVLGCKADGIWDAIKASCILAGARTLAGALTPLVGTAPTNNNFVSGDYNRRTGLGQQGDSSKWLNTNYANNADSRQNNNHQALFIYSYDASVFLLGDDFGTGGNTTLSTGANNTASTRNMHSSAALPVNAVLQSSSLLASARQGSASYTGRVNGGNHVVNAASVAPTSVASVAPTSADIGVFRLSQTSSFASINGRIQYYSLGNFLDLALLDSRVTDLINALGAAIP